MPLTVVITGAAGNIGGKLCAHLLAQGDYLLRLMDLDSRGDADILAADIAVYGERWTKLFDGADAIVHLAANASADADWSALLGPNVDAVLNVFLAAQQYGVKRVVLASSVWAMASKFEDAFIPAGDPAPGPNAYGATKLFGERVGRAFALTQGISTVALRIGACRTGANYAAPGTAAWEDACWISNQDVCHGLERAIRADIRGFAVVNLTSENPGSRWSLSEARQQLGYAPEDGYELPLRGRDAVRTVQSTAKQ